MTSPTITLEQAAALPWPAVVVGAGPAGSVAAAELARRRVRCLLLDKATFPRAKICGCCLNGRALAELVGCGLGGLARRLGAVPLKRFVLAADGRRAVLRLTDRVAVSRERFDAALVGQAVAAGAAFLPGARGRLAATDDSGCSVTVTTADARASLRAEIVLAADGLAGGFLPDDQSLNTRLRRRQRIGAGVTLQRAPEEFKAGEIWMACGNDGYVGMVRLENGQLDVAAALDPTAVRGADGIGAVAADIVTQAGFERFEPLVNAGWRGTPTLTRRRPAALGGRVLLLGDAAGYVEPFTGQGIAWALASGRLAAAVVAENGPNSGHVWARRYESEVRARQRPCSLMAGALRRPALVSLGIRVLAAAPGLAAPFVRRLNMA